MTADSDKPIALGERNRGGRQSKYRPEYCELVVELGKEGYSKAMIASRLNVDTHSLDRWAAEDRAFAGSMALARTHSLAWWEAEAKANIGNRNFNALLYRVAMSGRFPSEYRESQNAAVSVTVNTAPDLRLDNLSAEDRAALRLLLDKAKSTPESTPTIEHKPEETAESRRF